MERRPSNTLYKQSLETAMSAVDAMEESLRSSMAGEQERLKLEHAKEVAEYGATHDELTGLLNRRGLEIQYKALDKSEPANFALVSVDLDDLKEVNDNGGHQTGDDLLVRAAKVLKKTLRTEHDPAFSDRDPDIVTAARVGGDEFIMLLRNVVDPATMANVIERVRENLDINEGIRASMGGAIHRYGVDLAKLIKEADELMYQNKTARKGILRSIEG